MLERVQDGTKFFIKLGQLHDARIELVEWRVQDREVSIRVDDLNSAFLGLSDYKGLLPARLIFTGVVRFITEVDPAESVWRVYGIDIHPHGTDCELTLQCAPGGRIQITCAELAVET
jgi:hypothetical protein